MRYDHLSYYLAIFGIFCICFLIYQNYINKAITESSVKPNASTIADDKLKDASVKPNASTIADDKLKDASVKPNASTIADDKLKDEENNMEPILVTFDKPILTEDSLSNQFYTILGFIVTILTAYIIYIINNKHSHTEILRFSSFAIIKECATNTSILSSQKNKICYFLQIDNNHRIDIRYTNSHFVTSAYYSSPPTIVF
jgi:hypothetical protein